MASAENTKHDAEPAEQSENAFHHDQPRQRSESTDFAVRNRPKVMKLR